VLVPLFEKAPSLVDAARSVFQALIVNPFTRAVPTNDFTTRTDNIQSNRIVPTEILESIPIPGGLTLDVRSDGSVSIVLPNESKALTLSVTGLDPTSAEVFYVVTDGTPPEFDQPNWQSYVGEPFLTNRPGQNVYMMVKDGFDTHQVSFLKPATFISNVERIPASTMIQVDTESPSVLERIKNDSFVTKVEYENQMIDLFVIEPRSEEELQNVIVRYRANDHNKSLMLRVEALSWREETITPGDSIGVYIRQGDNVEFNVEYQFLNQESIREEFVVSSMADGIGILLPVRPNMLLRVILGLMVTTTLIAPFLIKPKSA